MSAKIETVELRVPATAAEPIELEVKHSGLRMVLVGRESIGLLGNDWQVLGVYFLLGPGETPEQFRGYVGKVGNADLVRRLKQQVKNHPWWNRALLVAAQAAHGLNSAEIGWLEARLHSVLSNATACQLQNSNRPTDNSLPPHLRDSLEGYISPIAAALRAIGAPPDTPDQKPPPKGRKPKRQPGTVSELIAAGLLRPGTRLDPIRKGNFEPAFVLEDGQLEVSGKPYATPSSAGQASSDLGSVNGWEYWGVPSGSGGLTPLSSLRGRLREGDVKPETSVAPPASPSQPPMETVKQPVFAATTQQPLTGIGEDPATRSNQAQAELVAVNKRITLRDLVDAKLVQPDQELFGSRGGEDFIATVNADGTVHFRGTNYATPSAAGKVAAGWPTCNGWDFWSTETGGKRVKLGVLRAELTAR